MPGDPTDTSPSAGSVAEGGDERESILLLDADGTVIEVLTLGHGVFDGLVVELEHLRLRDFLPPDLTAEIIGAIARAIQTGRTEIIRRRVCLGDADRLLEGRLTRIDRDEASKPRVICVLRDLTRETGLEEALRESEARLRTATDSLPFDFFLIGLDGRYAMVNANIRQTWGDLTGKRPEDLDVPAETKALWLENNRRAFAGETVASEVAFALEAGQIAQLVQNLCLNAAQAMPSGGTVRIQLVNSGYAKDPVLADPAGFGFQGVLRKPFRYQDLLAALGSMTPAGSTGLDPMPMTVVS